MRAVAGALLRLAVRGALDVPGVGDLHELHPAELLLRAAGPDVGEGAAQPERTKRKNQSSREEIFLASSPAESPAPDKTAFGSISVISVAAAGVS